MHDEWKWCGDGGVRGIIIKELNSTVVYMVGVIKESAYVIVGGVATWVDREQAPWYKQFQWSLWMWKTCKPSKCALFCLVGCKHCL